MKFNEADQVCGEGREVEEVEEEYGSGAAEVAMALNCVEENQVK